MKRYALDVFDHDGRMVVATETSAKSAELAITDARNDPRYARLGLRATRIGGKYESAQSAPLQN